MQSICHLEMHYHISLFLSFLWIRNVWRHSEPEFLKKKKKLDRIQSSVKNEYLINLFLLFSIKSHCGMCSFIAAGTINVRLSIFQPTTVTCTSGRLTTTQSSGERCGASVAWSAPSSMRRWVRRCYWGHLSKIYSRESVSNHICSKKKTGTEDLFQTLKLLKILSHLAFRITRRANQVFHCKGLFKIFFCGSHTDLSYLSFLNAVFYWGGTIKPANRR